MARKSSVLAFLAGLAAAAAAQAGIITAGDLVVSRVGDGTAVLGSTATATFLDEYTPAGVLVQTIPLPTAPSGANRQFSNSGSATSEGVLLRSADGRYLTLAGYDAALTTVGVAGTASATVNRVVARVAADGSIDTTTALSDAYSANNIRSAITTDGSTFYIGGTATTTGGVRVASLGGSTSTQLNSTVTNVRDVGIFGGQLYLTSASGSNIGVNSVGSGLPTTSGQTVTLLTSGDTGSPSPYGYFFADLDPNVAGAETLYVADDRTSTSGGLKKFVFNGTSYALAATFPLPGIVSGNQGLRGLTGEIDGNDHAVLFATSTDNRLVSFVDNGVNTSYTTLATGATNTAFRGVAFAPVAVPEPAGAALLVLAGLPMLLKRRRIAAQ